MAADAQILRERWDANKKRENALERRVQKKDEDYRKMLKEEAEKHSADRVKEKTEATEKFKESLKSKNEQSRDEMQKRLKERTLQAQQLREEGRRMVKEATEQHQLNVLRVAEQRKQAASEFQTQRADRVAEDLVGSIVHKAMLSQGSAGQYSEAIDSPRSPQSDQNNKSQASLASSVACSTQTGQKDAFECPRERWKKVKPPPVVVPWRLAKTHGLRRKARKQMQDARFIIQPEDSVGAVGDPADVWQEIYRAAIGRAANGEGLPAEEDPLSPVSVLPPNVPSTTDLFSSSSLHDGESAGYERAESLRSLAWRQRRDPRFCQLPAVGQPDATEDARPQVMTRLVPPKIPPSVMRR